MKWVSRTDTHSAVHAKSPSDVELSDQFNEAVSKLPKQGTIVGIFVVKRRVLTLILADVNSEDNANNGNDEESRDVQDGNETNSKDDVTGGDSADYIDEVASGDNLYEPEAIKDDVENARKFINFVEEFGSFFVGSVTRGDIIYQVPLVAFCLFDTRL